MRQLSNIFLLLQSITPEVKILKDFLVPKYFKTIVQTAKNLIGYNENKNTFTHPSITLKIGYAI